MWKRALTLLGLTAGLLVAAEALAAGAGATPVALLKSSTEKVRKILSREARAKQEVDRRNADLRREVNHFLDFDELGRVALGSHWTGLSPAQQREFLDVLRDLIETAYTTRIGQYAAFSVQYVKEEVKGDQAFVATVASAEGKSLKNDYRLHKVKGRWYVYDLIIEDTSLVEQYKTQFNRIIKKHGFDVLLERMRRRAAELRSPAPATATAQAQPGL